VQLCSRAHIVGVVFLGPAAHRHWASAERDRAPSDPGLRLPGL